MKKRRTVRDLHAGWMKGQSYAKAYAELGPEFAVASAIIGARTKAKLTQNELARRMDTTQTVVARLESGRTMPSTRTLTRVADATDSLMEITFAPAAHVVAARLGDATRKAVRASARRRAKLK
jgi:transcriptional regulator with XRE-family HTH domain